MLDIICLILMVSVNGRIARTKGQNPRKYRNLTILLWLGFELLGTMLGGILMMLFLPNYNFLIGATVLGLVGAAVGGFLSYRITQNAPVVNAESGQAERYSNYNYQMANGGYAYQTNPVYYPNQAEMLSFPATVKIIEELGGYSGGRDAFFINGQPICMMQPGSEYVFTTPFVKNTVTIGMPSQFSEDKEHSVRFIAADNGYIEIHAAAGRLLPDKFKNYNSK